MKAKKWIIAQPLSNPLKEENIKLVEFDLPDELQPEGITLHYLIIILLYIMISDTFQRYFAKRSIFQSMVT